MDARVSERGRIDGIDSLRAAAALVVVFDHLDVLPADLFGLPRSGLAALVRLTANCLFNGPAAVIVFFVISGLCIHLQQSRRTAPLDARVFYIRRSIRIGLPALAAIALYESLGIIRLDRINDTVIWSIICEAIYYILYPLLLVLGRRYGWGTLVACAYLVSSLICLLQLPALRAAGNAYTALGWLTPIVGLPCWLLGCWLAEQLPPRTSQAVAPRRLQTGSIWWLRAAIFGIAFALRVGKFHSGSVWLSNCFTLNLFALPVTVWIGAELAWRRKARARGWGARLHRCAEHMGKWSYSLYLIHPTATAILLVAGVAEATESESYHLLRLVFAFGSAYGFYLLVEAPAHRLAGAASRWPGLRRKLAV